MNQKAGLFVCVSEWADKNKSQMGRAEMASEGGTSVHWESTLCWL